MPEQRPPQRRRRAPGDALGGKLRPRSRWSKGLAAGGLTVGVAAGAFGGVAAASSDALPGDTLYGLKRGMEDLKLDMADGDADRGRVYLDQASTRLQRGPPADGARPHRRPRPRVARRDPPGPVRHAARRLRGPPAAARGVRARRTPCGPIQALSAFSRSHREAWSDLRERLPGRSSRTSATRCRSVFDAIDDEVAPLQSLLPAPPAARRPATGGATASSGHGVRRHSVRYRPVAPRPPRTGTDASGGSRSGTGSPSRSVRLRAPSSDGLLGGNTGGLLDPPRSDTGAPPPTTPAASPARTSPSRRSSRASCPGLGIDGEDAK